MEQLAPSKPCRSVSHLLLLGVVILLGGVLGQVQDPIRTICSNFCEYCYSQRDICDRCGEGFYFHEFYKVCLVGTIPGCQFYASRIVCSVCYQGYKNVRGTCQSCKLARCGACEVEAAVCQQCRVGYTFSTTTVTPASTCDLLCLVNNCKFCFAGNSAFCSVCADGYRLDPSNQCQKCTMTGCLRCSASVSVCDSVCIPGYYWLNGACQQCMIGCKTCSSTGACLACDTNTRYYMDKTSRCVLSGGIFGISWGLIISFFTLQYALRIY
jgi:hypothetical protein